MNNKRTIRIAVDAMGGDFAPHVVVEGAVDALRQAPDRIEVLLVGEENAIRAELRKYGETVPGLDVVHAPETVRFEDDAMAPVRTKKKSSIAVGLQLHKSGEADAFVSAGHTGAVMTASTLLLGRIEGVGRPTIAAMLPTKKGYCLLTDAGTNVDCRPQHLLEFGIMGSIFAEQILHYDRPAVGLLSFGEEKNKGNELTLGAQRLFEKSSINYIGNIEGGDILAGDVQVAVCDGFTGNVVLKFAEGVIDLLRAKFREFAGRSLMNKVRVMMSYGTLRKVLREFDYQEYGGVPLLGVNGVTIIGHGSSSAKAVKNMILKAEEMVLKDVNTRIRTALGSEQTREA